LIDSEILDKKDVNPEEYIEGVTLFFVSRRLQLVEQTARIFHFTVETTEEVVQDSTVKAWTKGASQYRSAGTPLKYFFNSILRNTAINYYRKSQREKSVGAFIPLEDFTVPLHTITDPHKDLEDLIHMFTVLIDDPNNLPLGITEQVMASVMGMPYQEIANELNIPIGTVRSRISRGREYCKSRLAECSEELSPSYKKFL
jgi:RNA polymerase sigma-70 factor, ECF subfamily